jgi:hypothetical protein
MTIPEKTASELSVTQPQVPTLWVREMVRFPELGPEDRIKLTPGVNVLVGAHNTGKSRWLRMLDYVLGDDKKPDEAFGEDVASRYESVRAIVMVAGAEWTIERHWKDEKQATKITVNDEVMTRDSFTLKLMSALQIPVMHYPQGNPYGTRSWPELGWRSIYRHMYRRQLFWADLADKQFESEQHACLLLFVGIAEVLFSDGYAKLVESEKKIQQLQNQREHFIAMLQEVSRELIDEKELGVALTPDSIELAVTRHEDNVADAQKKRDVTLYSLLDSTMKMQSLENGPSKDVVEELGRKLAVLRDNEEYNIVASQRTADRITEMQTHRDLIVEELGRMERAVEAGTLLADLKITHCPACDRIVDRTSIESGECCLCHRPVDASGKSDMAAARLKFEVDQLRAELQEAYQLLEMLAKEQTRLHDERDRFEEQIGRIQQQLRPVRSAAASVLPPELTVYDQEIGRLHERIAQLKRVRSTLDKRESLAAEIEKNKKEVAALQDELNKQSAKINFEKAGDLLTDGMNTYLNAIDAIKPKSWTQQQVDFVLRDRTFAVRIGQRSWQSKLGGTLTLFFLMAYHYALMTLTGKDRCHYPGFCVLDFPPQLDGVNVSDSENFVLEPFVRMLAQPDKQSMQVIAAGSSFASIEGANRIQFTKVWI